MADVWVLTGGIGSGKTTIRQTLDELGAITIDADRVGHAVLQSGTEAARTVGSRWPEAVVEGRIDRAALAAIVFSDAKQLRELESVVHPAITAAVAQQIAEAGESIVVVEVSVPKDLVGAGWGRTIVADLGDEERVRRLVDRGMDENDVRRRMANQPSRDGWRARGRWIISTAGTRVEVEAAVRDLWEKVITRRHETRASSLEPRA